MSLFVIGDKETVLGLALAGVDGTVVESNDAAQSALDDVLQRNDITILLITQNWTAPMQERIDRLKMTTLQPVILEIPGAIPAPSSHSLRALVQEAVGMRLGT